MAHFVDVTFSIHGLPVARGIAIGRAVLMVVEPRRRRALLHRAGAGRVRDRPGARRPQRGGRRAAPAAGQRRADGPERRAARTLGAARRAPDAAAGRGADRRRQALDHRAPLQRRMGAHHAARSAGAPVRRDGGRVPARAQGRPRAGGRAHAALHEGHGGRAGADAAAPQARRQDATSSTTCCWTTASTCRWC